MTKNFHTINQQIEDVINRLVLKGILSRDYTFNKIILSNRYKELIPDLKNHDFYIYVKNQSEILNNERLPEIDYVKAVKTFNTICKSNILFDEVKSLINEAEFCWICGIEDLTHKNYNANYNNGNVPICLGCDSHLDKLIDLYNEENRRTQYHMDNINKLLSKKHESKSCYIATLVYEDVEHPKVNLLREYRDRYLLQNKVGFVLVLIYYRFSPFVVKMLENRRLVNKVIKCFLNVLIAVFNKNRNT